MVNSIKTALKKYMITFIIPLLMMTKPSSAQRRFTNLRFNQNAKLQTIPRMSCI